MSGSRTGLATFVPNLPQRPALIGIGGAVACSPLPHHQDVRVRIRRFRGLRITMEQARETKRIEVGDGKRDSEGRTVGQMPGTVRAARRFRGEVPIDPKMA